MTVSETTKMIQGAKASLRLAAGAWIFSRHHATPDYAYQSLIQLFCLTGGWSNDVLAGALALRHPAYELEAAKGILGTLSKPDVAAVVADIKLHGFHVFNQILPKEICDQLEAFALKEEAIIRQMDQEPDRKYATRKAVYDPSSPQGIIYEFDPDVLINQPDVQTLMTDTSVISVAQEYIGSKPVLDEVNLWWTTAYKIKADASAAQLYHFDMDRIRWLKFFIYLTDVSTENGPHCFVEGSHRTGGIPQDFLRRGYTRIGDQEVQAAFPRDRLIEFTGRRGTIIAEDTRGLHKGRPVLKGHRLILEFEFSNSLFGGTPHKVSRFRTFHTREVERFVGLHSRMYERWLKK